MNAKIINENASVCDEPMEEIVAKETKTVAEEAEIEENDLIVIFKKPFTYEGKTYTEVDLTGVENMTGAQLCSAQRMYSKTGSVAMTAVLDPNYSCIVAHMVTKRPIEFFKALPAKELDKIKRAISGFFLNDD